MDILFAIFFGGGLGSVSRYILSRAITTNFTHINPVGTLAANLISTIILGLVLFFWGSKSEMTGVTKALLIAGFCGGFSTFSTFSYETFELLKSGNYFFAVANMAVSLLLGVGVLFILAKSI
ncbi:MAG: fluoride efflux transporter CrcB [Bacteroidales bacterium]|nr:fluoride efflux transporter CrcB [Bacteroidales bacterium]